MGVIDKMKRKMKIPSRFKVFAESIEPYFSSVKIDLLRARIDTKLTDFLAETCYKSFNMGLMFLMCMVILGVFTKNIKIIGMGLLIGPIITGFIFYSLLYGPKVKVNKKAKLIDKNLPFALRHLLIELKSGIPLYQAIVAISTDYDELSDEIRDIIKEINSGKSEIKAIEESISLSPTKNYRRAFWQILNAIKTGTDISITLESTVENITQRQLIAIKQYGQELNPWTLMYMMTAVIAPSLGLTFLMLLSSFTGLNIPEWGMYIMLFFLAVFQLFFLNVVKSRRPMVRI